MSFIYGKFLIPLVVLAIIGIFIAWREEKKYFKWVKTFWFYNRSLTSKLSSLLFFIGLFLLILSTLDLRGPEETISGDIPDQKTLILIDSSASMLAEDVRPNRYEKALILARHFVKKAVGHQISVAIFSDTTIPASPFTDDISFLDAKLGSLSAMNLKRGGTSLVRSINEGVQILKVHSGGREAVGNLLIFTDSEDHGDINELNVPESVNVALVGVGTRAGSRIPIKSKSGEFLFYKKYKGQEVITKLDEDKIKSFGTSIKNFKYWVALSYSVPTEDISRFFRGQFQKTLSKGEIKIRPVLTTWLMLPGVLLVGASLLLSFPSSFVAFVLFVSIATIQENVVADDKVNSPKEEAKPMSELHKELLLKSKSGQTTNSENLKLAEEMLKRGDLNQAQTLYEENLGEFSSDRAYFNYGTSLLMSGSKWKGAQTLIDLKEKIEKSGGDKDLLEAIRKNLKIAFKSNKNEKKEQKKDEKKKEEEKKKEDEKKKEEKKKEEDQKKDDESKKPNGKDGGESNKKDQKDQKKDGKDKGKDKKDDSDKKDSEKKKKDSQQQGKQKESKDKPKTKKKMKSMLQQLQEKEKRIKQNRKLQKIPGVIKQLMDEDKNIMKELLDSTSPKSSGDSKDW